MAFDQNLIPKDLRPLNTSRVNAEETRIVSTSGRPQDGFYPDAGFGGLGFLGLAHTVPAWGAQKPVPVGTPVVCSLGYGCNPSLGIRVGGNAADPLMDYGGEDSGSGKKVKFLCSFGGKILPRPSDGMLRYVGGQTRIISFKRDVDFTELNHKMVEICGQPVVIKYQLPDEDLDALVSVSCPEDLENMMDEYEKLAERSLDGSAKLRMFLFSASEIDSLGALDFGDLQDGGKRYVDAVNGVMEGVGGSITRKESISSVTSNQNSDMSGGAEAADTCFINEDLTVPPPAAIVSSKSSNPTSNGDVAKLVFEDAHSVPHVDLSTTTSPVPVAISGPLAVASVPDIMLDRCVGLSAQQQLLSAVVHADSVSHTAPLPVPVAKSGHLTASPMPEIMLDRPVAPAQQQHLGHDLQQTVGRFPPPPSAYFQGYVDPRQDALNRADYQKHHQQLVYGNPQVVAATTPKPIQIQPQYHDKPSTFVPQPQCHDKSCTYTIPTVPRTMTPSSSHLSMNPNVVHPLLQQRGMPVHADQSHAPYLPQVAGSYGWSQIPSPEHMAFTEGWMPHQQIMPSDKLLRVGNCGMCQKQLPRAHLDTVVQEPGDSGLNSVGANPVYHSAPLDDMTGILPGSKIVAGGPSGEGTVEKATGTGTNVLGKMNYEGGTPQAQIVGMSLKLEAQQETGRSLSRRDDDTDLVKMLGLQSAMEMQNVQTHGLVKGNTPQSSSEEATQQHLVPSLSQVKQDILMSKTFNTAVGSVSFKKPEVLAIDTGKECNESISGVASRDAAAGSALSYDPMRAVDGIEQLHISPPEILSISEQSKSHVDQPRKDDISVQKLHHILRREAIPNEVFCRPMVSETNPTKPSEVMPYSASEVPHQHNGRSLESYEVSQIPIFQEDEPATYQQIAPSAGLDNLATNSAVQSSISQCNWTANILDSSNSLFSNQDPWSVHHDSHFPPKPNKIVTMKETGSTRDPYLETQPGNVAEANTEVHLLDVIDFPSVNVDRDINSEQTQAGKVLVSAEELIKQELRAIAVGVAPSVRQSSASPVPDSSSHDGNIFVADSSDERLQQNNSDAAIQAKLEDMNIKPEKTNLGFPLFDGLGRLQIIKNSDLEELRELGSGTFGTVYHGKWRGTDVAIKRINDRCFVGKLSEQERMRDDFWNEAIKLADLHHPNVVAFYGVVLDGPGGSVATVTEYMVNGSLRTSLQKSERNLDKRKRVLIAMDVAFGMEYLHSKNIVHFDLKSDNLLVNLRDPHRPICKVGDLGLSKVKCQTLISGGVRGTLPWMAPELLNGSSSLVSEKVDVFSFGIVMWELLTGEEPYADLHYGAIIGGIVNNTLRPAVPENCDLDWRSLMKRCWSAEPSERPSFTQIASELRAMANKLPPKGQTPATNTRANV